MRKYIIKYKDRIKTENLSPSQAFSKMVNILYSDSEKNPNLLSQTVINKKSKMSSAKSKKSKHSKKKKSSKKISEVKRADLAGDSRQEIVFKYVLTVCFLFICFTTSFSYTLPLIILFFGQTKISMPIYALLFPKSTESQRFYQMTYTETIAGHTRLYFIF